MNWNQIFDEEIADFDALVPTWDKHATGLDADWDAEVDPDGDLNEAAAAAHDGAKGYEVTFDDANVAYGQLNFGAIDQVTACISLWFDPNSFTPENDRRTNIIQGNSGAPQSQFQVALRIHNGSWQIRTAVRLDTGFSYFNVDEDIPGTGDDWHHLLIFWAASTGAGNDDGYFLLYIDRVYWANKSATGLDNDTKDLDNVCFGTVITDATTFGGSYYMDECYIDPVGAPMVNTLAAHDGTYGAMIPVISSATTLYGDMGGPSAESQVTGEMWLNPAYLAMSNGDWIYIMTFAGPSGYSMNMFLTYDGSNYRIILNAVDDAVGMHYSGYHVISAGWHLVRMIWKASTGPGQNNGYARLEIDSVARDEIIGLDNDTLLINNVFFGPNCAPATSYGLVLLDHCRWSEDMPALASPPTARGIRVGRLPGPVV